jgi:hypothetical protein
MSAVLYPVAANADAALAAPLGRAAREREAQGVAGEPVHFVREFTGPVFKTEDAALDAYGGRIDDDRPGRLKMVVPQDRFCELKPIAERGMIPFTGKHTAWRLSVAYWRTASGDALRPAMEQARKARRNRQAAEALETRDLVALTDQPLQPLHPQKALDIGLFEVRLPENPDIIMPDE